MTGLQQIVASLKATHFRLWLAQSSRSLSITSAQNRWHKDKVENRNLRNFGYKDNLRVTGVLPRLTNDHDKLKAQPVYTPKDPFAPKRALMGQNDYIDIMGDDTIHPVDTHYHIPKWLRGFRSNLYAKFMVRKVNYYQNSGMKYAFPHDWNELVKTRDRELRKVNRKFSQKRFTNYEGIKHGPVPDQYKTRYPF